MILPPRALPSALPLLTLPVCKYRTPDSHDSRARESFSRLRAALGASRAETKVANISLRTSHRGLNLINTVCAECVMASLAWRNSKSDENWAFSR